MSASILIAKLPCLSSLRSGCLLSVAGVERAGQERTTSHRRVADLAGREESAASSGRECWSQPAWRAAVLPLTETDPQQPRHRHRTPGDRPLVTQPAVAAAGGVCRFQGVVDGAWQWWVENARWVSEAAGSTWGW